MGAYFARPVLLTLFFGALLLVFAYVLLDRRKGASGVAHANPKVLNKLGKEPSRFTKHLTPFLVLLAVLALIYAIAGPMGTTAQSERRATVVLVIDTSISMEATDVQPTRLLAAQAAAKDFINQLDPSVNVGLISFNGSAIIESEPTRNRELLKKKLDGLTLDKYTATGKGIATALDMIQNYSDQFTTGGTPQGEIILESDGKETLPISPDMPGGEYELARKAKTMNIPVNTISFGTPTGTIDYEGQTVSVEVDDKSLAKVAELSGGKAFTARNISELKSVYANISREISIQKTKTEQPFIPLLVAAVLLLAALASSLVWNNRIPR